MSAGCTSVGAAGGGLDIPYAKETVFLTQMLLDL
jgi:hypothetical protein